MIIIALISPYMLHDTMLNNSYAVNVIRGNDLSYDVCLKVQERPYSAFPAKG